MHKIKFLTQEDYHRKDGYLDFDIAQSGYLLHWGTHDGDTVVFVRDLYGSVHMVAPEWIRFEEQIESVLISRLTDLFSRFASEDTIEEMKAIINKYI